MGQFVGVANGRDGTFEIFFAGIFLEESFMRRRASKVVNHENGNRLDIILGVSCIEGQGRILIIIYALARNNLQQYTSDGPSSRVHSFTDA